MRVSESDPPFFYDPCLLPPPLLLLPLSNLLLAIDESHYLCARNLTPQHSAGVPCWKWHIAGG